MPSAVTIAFPDLQSLRQDLDSVELGLGRLVGEVGRKKLAPLVAEVQGLMPFDPSHRGWRGHDETWRAKDDPGHIRDSVTGGSARDRFTVYTTHPGGPVHWWGGSIRPRGVSIAIHHEAGAGEDFTSVKADEVARDLDSALGELLDLHRL